MTFFLAEPHVQRMFPLSFNLHEASSHWFLGNLPSYVLIGGITITSLVSRLWFYRPYFDRNDDAYMTGSEDVYAVLYTTFGLSIICSVASAACMVLLAFPHLAEVEILRNGVPFLLVFAQALLILGTVIAVWTERKSHKPSLQINP
jgi:hypothetical protein